MAQVIDTKGLYRAKLLAWIKRVQIQQAKTTQEYDKRILEYYKNVALKNVTPYVKAVQLKLEANPDITVPAAKKLTEVKELAEALSSELAAFSTFATIELDLASKASVERAVADIGVLATVINMDRAKIVTPSAIEILRNYLSQDGPLYKRIQSWSGVFTDKAIEEIIKGVSLGRNPVVIARQIYRQFGVSLSDAIRATRTVQLWSYREATRANYIANSDMIQGWIWFAALDGRTCLSCLNMHGTVHPLSESLDDHPNGRCAMLPYPQGADVITQMGKEWFDGQSEELQQEMMGKLKWEAYKGGAFDFSEQSKQTPNDVYGSFRSETPLWELLGAESPNYKG